MAKTPDVIYLQIPEDLFDDEAEVVYGHGDSITWCVDKINDTDVKYVRADLVVASMVSMEKTIQEALEAGGE